MTCTFWTDLIGTRTECVSDSAKGYFVGGYTSISGTETWYNTTKRIDLESGANLQISTYLSTARGSSVGVNSASDGYSCSGTINDSSSTSSIESLSFSSETMSTVVDTINQATADSFGFNSASKGYVAGGWIWAGFADIDAIDGFLFANETISTLAAVLSVPRSIGASVCSSIKGYAMGGYLASNEIDGIQFDTEAAINPAANLSVARQNGAGINSVAKGYCCGGIYGATWSTEIDGIDFDTEAAINPSATLTAQAVGLSGVNSTDNGFLACGLVNGYGFSTDVTEFNFHTGTISILSHDMGASISGTSSFQSGGYL